MRSSSPQLSVQSSSRIQRKQKLIKDAFVEPKLKIAQEKDCQSSTESEDYEFDQETVNEDRQNVPLELISDLHAKNSIQAQ